MNSITVILLNYRRPGNMPLILDALSRQSIKPTIWLWNNAGQSLEDPRVEREIVSTFNFHCWPRWFLASYATTDHVMMMDDDLVATDDRFLEIAIDALDRQEAPEVIVGSEGVVLGDACYWPAYQGRIARDTVGDESGTVHVRKVREDVKVDIVKGRCMVMKTSSLRQLPLTPEHRDTCDDIVVSALLARGRRRLHLVSAAVGSALEDIVDTLPEVALSRRPDWREVRDCARAHYYRSDKSAVGYI